MPSAKIGSLNESSLHKSLKALYSNEASRTELAVGKYICDIVLEDESIIEIQTSNLSSIRNKIASLLESRKVKLVFPIIENNYIRNFAEIPTEEKLKKTKLGSNEFFEKSYRKSPKHETLFSIFKEITAFYFLLDHKNLELDLAFVDIETIKIDDKKGRSPYKRARIADKKLLKINSVKKINSLKDLICPVLDLLEETFCRADLEALTNKKDASFTLWLLKKCGAVEFYKKDGKKHLYRKSDTF